MFCLVFKCIHVHAVELCVMMLNHIYVDDTVNLFSRKAKSLLVVYILLAELFKVANYKKAKATKTLLPLVLPYACSTKALIY